MTEQQAVQRGRAGRWLAVTLIVIVVMAVILVYVYLPEIAAIGMRYERTERYAGRLLVWLDLRAIDQYYDLKTGSWGWEAREYIFGQICARAEKDLAYRARLLKAVGTIDRKSADGNGLIHYAAYNGTGTLAAELIARGADFELLAPEGWTPLMYAVVQRKPAMVVMLIEKGADIYATDSFGNGLLHKAAMVDATELATLLLDRGLDIGAVNIYGDRPLHLAAGYGGGITVTLLLDRGAAVDARNLYGRTPLMCAASRDPRWCEAAVKVLLGHGADVNAISTDGRTATDFASGVALDLLRQHGGKTAAELAVLKTAPPATGVPEPTVN